MVNPIFDPREYFLIKLDFRIQQVDTEYSALIETFNSRMNDYVSSHTMAICAIKLICAGNSLEQ
jgi:hypothetical protein